MTIETTNLHPILLKNPKDLYHANLFKARFFKVATIINFICISIFAVYLISLINITVKVLPITHLIIGIAIPILSVSFTIFNEYSKDYYKLAKHYKEIELELKTLQSKNEEEIKNYLYEINCYSVTNIRQILPALAYYRVRNRAKENSLNEIKKIFNTETDDENLLYEMIKQSSNIYKNECLKNKLKLAQLYHIINNPTDKKMLNNLGKSFGLSFIFYDHIQKQRQRKGLSFTEISEKEISDISNLIFEN